MRSIRIFNIFFSLLFASIAAFAYYVRDDNRKKARLGEYPRDKVKGSFVEPFAMIFFIEFYIYLGIYVYTETNRSEHMVLLFLVLVYIGLYYALLLCIMPLLRRVLDTNACAALWVLPGIAYCVMNYALTVEPIFMVNFPKRLIKPVTIIWFTGAAIVLGYQIISHFAYRIKLRRSVIQKASPELIERWQRECRRLGVKRKISVYISEIITTPVTVGLFALTMRLYLPNRSYTDEELGFITRHEAQHIARGDTRNKLFLGVIAAVNWFNPFSWAAMKRAAEDFELSCDEEVLCNAYPYEREAYAELILSSADTAQGYSTCLSASAKSLKYRLKRIMHPGKRFGGTLAVFIAMIILMCGMGTVGIADTAVITVGDIISLPEDFYVERVYVHDGWRFNDFVYGCDEAALADYVQSLRVREIVYGTFDESDQDNFIEPGFIGEDYYCYITIDNDYVSIRENEYRMRGKHYVLAILADTVDWEYINTLLDFSAENPDPSPETPWAYLDVDYVDDEYNHDQPFGLTGEIISATQDGEPYGVLRDDGGEGGIYGVEPGMIAEARLSFSYEPRDGYTVTVENWDRTESYTVTSDELIDGRLPIEDYSVHYTIEATFDTYRNTTYEMRFRFGIHYGPDEITG